MRGGRGHWWPLLNTFYIRILLSNNNSKHTKTFVVNLCIPDNSIVFHSLIRIQLTCAYLLLGYLSSP